VDHRRRTRRAARRLDEAARRSHVGASLSIQTCCRGSEAAASEDEFTIAREVTQDRTCPSSTLAPRSMAPPFPKQHRPVFHRRAGWTPNHRARHQRRETVSVWGCSIDWRSRLTPARQLSRAPHSRVRQLTRTKPTLCSPKTLAERVRTALSDCRGRVDADLELEPVTTAPLEALRHSTAQRGLDQSRSTVRPSAHLRAHPDGDTMTSFPQKNMRRLSDPLSRRGTTAESSVRLRQQLVGPFVCSWPAFGSWPSSTSDCWARAALSG
jgi:hypothetical protein